MCTVTFIPVNKLVFITHNRDEKTRRSKAIPPAFAGLNGVNLLFPKDGEAGGSWVGVNEYGGAAALLNGAFKAHIPAPPYRKSRGLVFLDLLSTPDMLQAYQQEALGNIEPFTVILWKGKELFECRWDGTKKFINELDPSRSHMWSSATLYDETIIEKRLSWLQKWQHEHPHPAFNEVIDFHLRGGDGDRHNDLNMNRNNELTTLSITAMALSAHSAKMKYLELNENITSEYRLSFKKEVVESR